MLKNAWINKCKYHCIKIEIPNSKIQFIIEQVETKYGCMEITISYSKIQYAIKMSEYKHRTININI